MGNLRLVSVMLNTLENWYFLILRFRIKSKEFLIIRYVTRWSQGLISCACSISKQFRRGNMGLISVMPGELMSLLMDLVSDRSVRIIWNYRLMASYRMPRTG